MHSSQPNGFQHYTAALQSQGYEPPLQTRKFVYSGVPESYMPASVRVGPAASCSKRSSAHRRGNASDHLSLQCEVSTHRHRQAANYIFKSTNKRICVLGDAL